MKRTGTVISLAVAVLGISATGVFSASASTGGHFTIAAHHATLKGTEKPLVHTTRLEVNGGSIECTIAEYIGTMEASTEAAVKVTPTYHDCWTTASHENDANTAGIFLNSCFYTLTVSKSPSGDNTVHLNCPAEQELEIVTSTCTMNIPPQTPSGGVAYTTTSSSGYHELTTDLTVEGITVHREAGICIFLGTTTTAKLSGSATFAAYAEQLDLTAT